LILAQNAKSSPVLLAPLPATAWADFFFPRAGLKRPKTTPTVRFWSTVERSSRSEQNVAGAHSPNPSLHLDFLYRPTERMREKGGRARAAVTRQRKARRWRYREAAHRQAHSPECVAVEPSLNGALRWPTLKATSYGNPKRPLPGALRHQIRPGGCCSFLRWIRDDRTPTSGGGPTEPLPGYRLRVQNRWGGKGETPMPFP
jgi:hypothetical protein